MSARAVINTPREDREGDVIVPRGVHLENYRNNPVVLWEHGLGELTRPIAKCQQPDGKLALHVSDHEITATSFFTDKCLESLQIFHLIAEGLVRATSVRALPIKSAIRKTSNAGSGIILEEWELIEWSWGALGVNPDAIARTLDRGTIEGRKITAPLLKSLQAVLPADQISIPGWSAANKTNVEISRSIKSTASQQAHHPPLSDSPKEAQSISFKSASNETCEAEIEVKDKNQRIPLGAQLLRFISDSISQLTDQVSSTEAILENERIQQRLKPFLQALQDEQNDLNQLYQKIYKHLPSQSDSEHTPQSPDSMKSPLHSEFPLLVKETQLNRFANSMGSPQLQNYKTLRGSSDQRQLMEKILKEIQLQNDAPVSISNQKLEEHVESLSKSLAVLQQKICDLLPAQKK
ncbi:hypothetical protein F1728_15560 [Gimesia benthica]|uniref:Uncharacterized protein n=1 Tax=Gimesia benthica TaxID=2608982 RepID=A0A6I6ABX7_9PLAN|nr:hypothetical protein [Gimesia benthica]QGQ24014.1 hypothetical protein F1728_15560 [Gimesia benthica]